MPDPLTLEGSASCVVFRSRFSSQSASRPWTTINAAFARANRAVLFRRALKLVNGGLGNIVMPGLTIASENPVYVQGHYNANGAGFGDGNASRFVRSGDR